MESTTNELHQVRLKAGTKAPDFSLLNQLGDRVELNDLKGKKLCLFFYPEDLSPTCTKVACNLRDNYLLLKSEGYHLFGISKDSAQKHKKFIEKHSLPFDLLVDEDNITAKAYDVWGKKKFMGRIYDGILRTTFLINEKGMIQSVITKVESAKHAQQIVSLTQN